VLPNRKIEDRIDVLLEYLTDYIYTVSIEDNKVIDTYHSSGCVAVTGYTSEDYENDSDLWLRMVHKEDKDIVVDQAKRATAGENVKPLEHRIIHKDGYIRWVKNSIVLSKDNNGKVLFYDGIINDITELKNAEYLNQVKHRQLIQADKMASLGVLVSGIAHEMNNPNNFISLNVKFLEKVWRELKPVWNDFAGKNEDYLIVGMSAKKIEENIAQSLDGITKGANRISKITRSLTNYAKKDHGKLDDDINLNEVVQNAVLITENLIRKFTNKFEVNYNSNLPIVKGNMQQLEQVVINLINNSCQSLDSKDSAITINLHYDESDNYAVVEVADEGVGIDKVSLMKIFDPFFTTKRNSGGTGLGLSISYNIVKHHDGELVIKSDVGDGTHCYLKLPINRKM